jgi:hypothetical protein
MTSDQWQECFEQLLLGVKDLSDVWKENPKLILTEGDLQGQLWLQFTPILAAWNGLSLHSEVPFLDNNDKLRWYPDIVVFEDSELHLDGELYQRKGSTYTGQCLAFELKLNRTEKVRSFNQKWKEDIDKLASIKRRHYENDAFTGAFILFSHKPIPLHIEQEICAYATDREILAICHWRQ